VWVKKSWRRHDSLRQFWTCSKQSWPFSTSADHPRFVQSHGDAVTNCYGCIMVYHDFLNRGRSGREIVTVWPRLCSQSFDCTSTDRVKDNQDSQQRRELTHKITEKLVTVEWHGGGEISVAVGGVTANVEVDRTVCSLQRQRWRWSETEKTSASNVGKNTKNRRFIQRLISV